MQSTVPMMARKSERIVATRFPAHEVPPVTRVRSTALHAALRALERSGQLARYTENLPDAFRPTILSVVPATWLDVKYAVAHYAAIDALSLPVSQQIEIASSAGSSAQRYLTATLVRMSQRLGLTPWTVTPHSHRLWARMCEGGDISVDRAGPKESVVTIYGLPYCKSQFFRVAMRAVFQEALSHLCRKGYVTEVSCTRSTLALRQAWA